MTQRRESRQVVLKCRQSDNDYLGLTSKTEAEELLQFQSTEEEQICWRMSNPVVGIVGVQLTPKVGPSATILLLGTDIALARPEAY
jgi:hypothetical protein